MITTKKLKKMLTPDRIEQWDVCNQVRVQWDKAKLIKFKKIYLRNLKADDFTFEGNKYVPAYAKYLIEYLEGRFV